MTTPNRSNITIGMNQLNQLGAVGSKSQVNAMDPADHYYHSPQRSLDYSNPSLDDQPSDEFSLHIRVYNLQMRIVLIWMYQLIQVFILCYVILLHQQILQSQ